jgi:hypothetical protein
MSNSLARVWYAWAAVFIHRMFAPVAGVIVIRVKDDQIIGNASGH